MPSLTLTADQYLEVEKLALGVFAPLRGFMSEAELNSCVQHGRLPDGNVFTIPIVLDVDEGFTKSISLKSKVDLTFQGKKVGVLYPESFYRPNKEAICKNVFGTTDTKHPGVQHFSSLAPFFVSGSVELIERTQFFFSEWEKTPEETKKLFKDRGWKTVVGFQTRNVPHRAHEYLQRIALETVDGLMIQPLVGKKKPGDFTPEAVLKGYETLIANYYPQDRVTLSILSTVMRYAGPREAVFHAMIRRNYGCSHFIVGRDHAGVGNFYGKYEAHQYISQFESDLGIKILKLHGPFYCHRCDSIATEQTCGHYKTDPKQCVEISGTMMRGMLKEGRDIDARYIRPEVVKSLEGINVFIE